MASRLFVQFGHPPRFIRQPTVLVVLSLCALPLAQVCGADKAELALHPLPNARFHFDGKVGNRIQNNVDHWLLPAPTANPGMLEMFRVRDRQPKPELVPWAGEFVGKYLISAIQALRMTERPELRTLVTKTVNQLISVQAEDGYLGPFPLQDRLRGNWDLWGHYHCMLALLMWHEATGDNHALQASRRAADLVCNIYLGSERRVWDAGSHEMNMAIVHSLGRLYRITQEPRYLQMMREIAKDWERAGDYFRTGVNQVEFFQTPRPRWESLHDLQGLVEFYRITGEVPYRQAFAQHWTSILRWDRRNTGGFSSGEQATGNPYANSAIETCCTIAWMALTADMLQLTGDSRPADELELSFYNAALGAQHPSGRWCTYNTPMNGSREASAHTIVFQSRAGTPELNCCSVNGPRGLGILSEWAVLAGDNALAVNYYGPGMFQGKLADNTPVALTWATDYPLSGQVLLRVEPLAARRFQLLLRIPSWSTNTTVDLNGKSVGEVTAGHYLALTRRWEPGDKIVLNFEMRLRAIPGDREALGTVSVYRGPLLLAYDQALNSFDDNRIPPLDLARLGSANEVALSVKNSRDSLEPWLVLDLPSSEPGFVRVCDFASAGATGTRYRSWLPATPVLPPVVVTRAPIENAHISAQAARFQWSGPKRPTAQVSSYDLLISSRSDFSALALSITNLMSSRVDLDDQALGRLAVHQPYWWKVIARNQNAATESVGPASRFVVDPSVPKPLLSKLLTTTETPWIQDPLRGKPTPTGGDLVSSSSFTSRSGPGSQGSVVETDGKSGNVTYRLEEFPEEDYSVAVWVQINALPVGRIGQVCSAWTGSVDDPLRITIDNGKVYARIEAGQNYSTGGTPIAPGQWHHLTAVKSGTDLTLFVDGEKRGHTTVPLLVTSQARDIALGANPHYTGSEYLAGQFSQFAFYGRALSAAEIGALAKSAP